SVPFFSYGGVLAGTEEARELLLKKASMLASDLDASRVELRQGEACDIAWQETSAKITMEIPLPASSEELWKRLSSGRRNTIATALVNKGPSTGIIGEPTERQTLTSDQIVVASVSPSGLGSTYRFL